MRELFLPPTLNIIQPIFLCRIHWFFFSSSHFKSPPMIIIFYHRRTYFNLQSFLHTLPFPHHPCQRGTNENTNGLLREYFPKTVDINQSDSYVEAKMKEINLRPRKCLNWKTPYEVYHSVELHLT